MTKSKTKKIVIVTVLTLLIWVWAYLETEQNLKDLPATIKISQAIDPSLLVTFDGQLEKEFEMTVAGPAKEIDDLKSALSEGREKLNFDFNAEVEGMDSPGKHTLNLLKILQDSEKMKSLGLTVDSCSVKNIDVTVEKLVEKQLTVECRDEYDIPLQYETINPPRVKMFVPKDWVGADMLKAYVKLQGQAKEDARKTPVTLKPYIPLIPGEEKLADESVEVKLKSTERPRTERTLPGAEIKIGYVFSTKTKGKYDVRLIDDSKLRSTTSFDATEAAFNAYKEQQYQVLIEIRDEDIGKEIASTEAIYNFPQEYIAKNEIKLAGTPPLVKFELVEIDAQSSKN
jgi:hypothetical protein